MGMRGRFGVVVKIMGLALDAVPVTAGLVARVKAQVRARATVIVAMAVILAVTVTVTVTLMSCTAIWILIISAPSLEGIFIRNVFITANRSLRSIIRRCLLNPVQQLLQLVQQLGADILFS